MPSLMDSHCTGSSRKVTPAKTTRMLKARTLVTGSCSKAFSAEVVTGSA